MEKLKKFFNKIRNWLVFGSFTELFLITYKCDQMFGTLVVKADDETEARYLANNELKKRHKCKNVTILEINRY